MNFSNLECLVRKWADDRGLYKGKLLTNIEGQFKKLNEEVSELLNANNREETIDAIGDIMVALTHIAYFNQATLTHCYQVAYEEIKNRKGKMVNGIFVKE